MKGSGMGFTQDLFDLSVEKIISEKKVYFHLLSKYFKLKLLILPQSNFARKTEDLYSRKNLNSCVYLKIQLQTKIRIVLYKVMEIRAFQNVKSKCFIIN